VRAESQLREKSKPDVCQVPAEGREQANCEQTDS
jgi:hypothetical protein